MKGESHEEQRHRSSRASWARSPWACSPGAARRARRRRRRRRRRPSRTWRSPRRRPTSRPATSTSTTCSPPAATPARSTSTACPSMRHLSTIPVFTPYPATGYGFDDETKAMLGDLTWGDVHHPALSETNGDYDGRWLFVNDMNGRVARIDLRDFKTKQIFGPVPNISGNHASAFVTPEHRVLDDGARASRSRSRRARSRRSTSTPPTTRASWRPSRSTRRRGEMSLGWEILMPPFDYDLGDAGKKASDGWMFWTSLQHRARHRQARGDRLAARPRLHRRRRLEGGREGRGRGQGRHDRRREGARPEEGAGHRLPDALRQVAPRRRRRARRQVDRRLGQAPGRHHGLQLREDPDRDPQQGLHRRRGRHPGPEVRVDQGRRGPGRPRAAAHAVRARRLRLHLALRGQRDRQVEARHLGGRGQGPDVVLDRPPARGRGRHRLARTASTWSASTSSRTAATCRSGRRSPSRRSSWTSARRR